MPIQITQEDTRLSFAYAINGAQNALTISRDAEDNRTDGIFKDSAKVVARIPTNLVLGTLAAIETVVKAVLTGLSAVLYFATDRPFNYMKDSLSLAGRATVEAFKGIAGYATPAPAPVVVEEQKEEEVTPLVVETQDTTEVETQKEEPLTKTQIAKNLARLAYDNKGKIALGMIVTGLVAYNIGLPALNGLFQGFKTGVSTFGSDVKDNVESTGSGLSSLAGYGINATSSALDYVASFVRSNSTNSTFTGNATNSTVVEIIKNATNATNTTV